MAEEGLRQTENELIYIGEPIQIQEDFLDRIVELGESSRDNPEDIREMVAKLAPTYKVRKSEIEIKRIEKITEAEEIGEAQPAAVM